MSFLKDGVRPFGGCLRAVAVAGALVGGMKTASATEVTVAKIEPPEWIANGYDAEALDTYRLYVVYGPGPLEVVFGNASHPLSWESSDGQFWNSSVLDSLTAPQDVTGPPLNFWENQWDTYVTIGTMSADGDATSLAPGPIEFADQVNDLAASFTATNAAWFVSPGSPQGCPPALIAQITVNEGVVVTGVVNLQFAGGAQHTDLQFTTEWAGSQPPTPADCNGNGVPDECDISFGTSDDCNDNDIPDECDIASGTSADVNENGVPDECDSDCNQNGIPDDSDIATGTSSDANVNTIPDECECWDLVGNDGVLDVDDLLSLLAQWGSCAGCAADITNDGVVDVADLLLLLGAWGPCTPWEPCEVAQLLPSDLTSYDYLGKCVSVSGDVAIVGQSAAYSGSAYVFRHDGSSWVEEQKLLAWYGFPHMFFASSVSVSDSVAIVGAPNDDDNGSGSGSAYVFRYDGGEWLGEQKLLASDGASGDSFGRSVSVSGDVAIVGAPGDDSAYVFRWNGSSWVEEQKLVGSPAADHFGVSVSVSGDVAVIGADRDHTNGDVSGSAYIFRWDGSTWIQEQKFLGTYGEFFGFSVSVSGDLAIVGTSWSDYFGSYSGSAYVFRYDGSSWAEEQQLVPADGADVDLFGESVSVSGDVAIVGARWDDDNGMDSGSAYVFRWNGSSWVQAPKLLASDGDAEDEFGRSVSVDGDVAVISAVYANGVGPKSGAAYVFDVSGDWCP